MNPPLNEIHVGEPPVLLQKRKGFGWVGLFAGVIFIAGMSGFLWMNYDHLIDASPSRTAASAAASAEAEPTPTVADFQLLQQQTTQSWQSTNQLVEAQSAELKRLAEQVAALTARIEQMQSGPTAAATPLQRVEPPRPPVVVQPPRPAPTAPRKQPAAAPRPSGSISLGGAPLPGAPPPPLR